MKFYYYYNRVESASQRTTVLTLKFQKEKWNVGKIICIVPSETINRKIRPYCVVGGNADKIKICKNIAVIE
jgi:hypothetical protein